MQNKIINSELSKHLVSLGMDIDENTIDKIYWLCCEMCGHCIQDGYAAYNSDRLSECFDDCKLGWKDIKDFVRGSIGSGGLIECDYIYSNSPFYKKCYLHYIPLSTMKLLKSHSISLRREPIDLKKRSKSLRNKIQNLDETNSISETIKHQLNLAKYIDTTDAEKRMELDLIEAENTNNETMQIYYLNRIISSNNTLMRLKEGKWPVNVSEKTGIYDNPMLSLCNDFRKELKLTTGEEYLGEADFQNAHMGLMSYHIWRLSGYSNNQLLLKEIEKWNDFFFDLNTKPAVKLMVLLKDHNPTYQDIKDRNSWVINGYGYDIQNKKIKRNTDKLTKAYHKWIQTNFPYMYKVWSVSDIEQTGANISKYIQSPIINDPEIVEYCDSIGYKLNTQADGIGIFGFSRIHFDSLINKIVSVANKHGVNIVVTKKNMEKESEEEYRINSLIRLKIKMKKELNNKRKKVGIAYKNNDQITINNINKQINDITKFIE